MDKIYDECRSNSIHSNKNMPSRVDYRSSIMHTLQQTSQHTDQYTTLQTENTPRLSQMQNSSSHRFNTEYSPEMTFGK